MKIKKKEFVKTMSSSANPEEFLTQVVNPFVPQIQSRSIAVYIARRNNFSDLIMTTDWKKYQLVVFNILQNAVKYN